MDNQKPTVEVPVEFLTELLNIRREHFIVCELFKIPFTRRGEEWVGKGIKERVFTYLTSYVNRRSIAERENGAAFVKELNALVSDPDIPGETNGQSAKV